MDFSEMTLIFRHTPLKRVCGIFYVKICLRKYVGVHNLFNNEKKKNGEKK